MGILTIKNNETIINKFEVESIKVAKKYVDENTFPASHAFIFSTFNETGVENTINIQKR